MFFLSNVLLRKSYTLKHQKKTLKKFNEIEQNKRES